MCATECPRGGYAVEDGPTGIALGDVNGDGALDMAVSNEGSGSVSVLINAGDGTFGASVPYTAGSRPSSVALGDLNGDDALDMVVANGFFSSDDDVSVFLNAGDGTFGAQVRYSTGAWPWSVSIGDVDGDGARDLAVANKNSNDISVLINLGDGTFAKEVRYTAGVSPESVAMADLDCDGSLDLAVANAESIFGDDVSILLNAGDGTFADQVFYTAAFEAQSIALGDLDGNGTVDVATAGPFDVAVLLNAGDGTFGAPDSYTASDEPQAVALGDVDGDGTLDLAVAHESFFNQGMIVRLNAGDGTFGAAVDYAAGDGPRSLALGDVNGDNAIDAAVVNNFGDDVSILLNVCPPPCAADFDGSGDVGFADLSTLLNAWGPCNASRVDLNGDGRVGFSDLTLLLATWGPCT